MNPYLFRVAATDSVATALDDLAAGTVLRLGDADITLNEAVGRGHKVALRAMAPGEPVLKFGFPIGRATSAIAPGDRVHTHNVSTALEASANYAWHPLTDAASDSTPRAGFAGYRRADGRVGTRNEIWVIPTVGCVARTAQKIAERADRKHTGRIDGIHALTHPFGCSQLGDDLDATRSVLAALAAHPNAGGVLLIGLGCESNQLDRLLAEIDTAVHGKIRTLAAQVAGDEIEEGLALIDAMVEDVALARRTEVPLSALVLGVKCGGSDGFSGLTSNPLVGRMSDAVTGAGGTAILTEIPEIFGAEQLLM
ncbi:MAG: UxaA family hydrolase, partial [Sphingomonas sp.]